MAASTAFFQSLHFFTEGITYVNELNKSLTEISIVTGQTQEQVAQLGEEYNRLAQSMGVLTNDIARATVEFYRQGLSQEEVMNRTSVATQYAKISALDFKRSAEILTATVNSMGVDIERASDVFSYLGDATATGADEIGIAFQRVGGTAGAVNLEFEKTASWIAVLSSRTREGAATIGNSIKSILARVQSMREKGFTEEDGTSVNQVAKALNEVNIALMDNEGNFRNFGTVMDELGGKWGTLDSRTKAYLATTIAGTYQQSRFLNLMEGYADTIPLYEKALKSAGVTQDKFNLYQQGTEAQLNKLKATWEGLWMASFDSETIQLIVSSFNTMATVLKNTVETFGLLPPILGITGVSILAFNGGLQRIITNGALVLTTLKGIPLGLRTVDSALAATTLKMNLMNGASRALTVSLNGLKTASMTALRFTAGIALPFAAFAGIGLAIGKVTEKINEYKQRQQEIQKQNEDIRQSYSQNSDEINRLVNNYEILNSQVEKGTLSKDNEEYIKTSNRLNEIFPILTRHVDERGNATLRSVDAIKQEISYAEKLQDNYAQLTVASFEKSLDEQQGKFDDLAKEAERLQKALNGGFATYTPEGNLQAQRELIQNERELQLMLANSSDYMLDKVNAFLEISGASQNLSKDTQSVIDSFIQEKIALADVTKEGFNFQEFLKSTVNEATDLGEKLASVPESLRSMFDSKAINEFSNDQISVLKSINSSVADGYTEWEQYKQVLESVGFKNVDELIANLTNGVEGNTKALQNNEAAAKELAESYDNAVSNISDLNGIINDLNENHSLSADSISTIMSKYDQLLPYINDEATLRMKVAEQIAQEEKVAKQAMLGKLQYNQTFYKAAIEANTKQVQTFQKAYGVDLKAYKSLGQAKVAVENKVLGAIAGAWESHTQRLITMTRVAAMTGNPMMQGIGMALGALKDQATAVTADFNDIFLNQVDVITGASIATNGLSDSTDKASKSYENSIYVSDKFKTALEKINFELEKQRAIQETFPKHSKQYQSALKNEISLLSQKKKLLEDQTKALNAQIKAGKIQQTGIITSSGSSPTSTVSSSTNSYAKGNSVQDTIWNFLKSKGFTDNIVAGIMGNFQLESNFNPSNVNRSSGAFGLAQWLGGRKTALSNYAKSQGTSMSDLNTQLNFLWKELNSTEKRTLNYLNSNQNASAAQIAAMFDKLFERSEGTHVPIRQKYANQILAKYSGTTPVSTVSSSASEASKEAAEQAQAVDQAKSELLQLQQDAMGVGAEIQRLQLELIKTPLYQAENRFRQIDSQAKIYDARLEKQDEWSEGYRKNLQNQNILLKEKKKLTEQNMIYIEKELKTNVNLTEIQKDELRQTYLDLRDTLVDIDNQIVENINRNTESLALEVQKRIDDTLKKIQDKMSNFEYGLSYEQARGQNLEKGSQEYASNIRNQSIYIKDQLATVEEEQKAIEKLLKTEKLSAEQKEELRKRYKELNLESVTLRNELVNLNDELNDSIVNILEEQRSAYFDGLRKDLESQRKLLEKQIEDAEDYYEPLIEAKQEQLKLLDEEYEKEDRLKRLREIDDEINDVKNDKRFSYITEQGEEILTYDKARVSELEKERDELLKQYQREDIKKAIQDEIDNLEKAKDDRIELLNEELKELQENYDLQIEEEEKRWDELIQSAQEGTLSYSELMNSWYGTSIASLTQYGVDLAAQIENIKALYASMGSLRALETSVPSPTSGSGSSGGDSSSGTSKTFSSAKEERDFRAKNPNDPYTVAKDTRHLKYLEEKGADNWSAADKIDYEKLTERQGLDEHHEGGVVGQSKSNRLTELANKLFNVKPNEQVIKSLKGELQVPPKNIPNLFTNIGNMVSSLLPNQSPVVTQSGDTFHLHNVTIQANNPQELWKGLQMQIRMNK